MRVFALLDHNYYVAGCVFLLGLAPVGVGIVIRLFLFSQPILLMTAHIGSHLLLAGVCIRIRDASSQWGMRELGTVNFHLRRYVNVVSFH